MKCCGKCGETKPSNEFSRGAKERDGLQHSCKRCNAAYRVENKERIAERKAAYHIANRDRCNTLAAEWRAANPEKSKAAIAKWYRANREKCVAAATKWQKDNPEACRIRGHNRRSREAGGKLSKDLAERLYRLQRGKCACGCNQSLGDKYHLDHVMPLALGGSNTDGNIQLLRRVCNLQKHAKHPIDFMQSRGFLL